MNYPKSVVVLLGILLGLSGSILPGRKILEARNITRNGKRRDAAASTDPKAEASRSLKLPKCLQAWRPRRSARAASGVPRRYFSG